jgi:hypothetical protein
MSKLSRRSAPVHSGQLSRSLVRALCLLALLAAAGALAACGRCGDFPLSSQTGACHSDPPPQ